MRCLAVLAAFVLAAAVLIWRFRTDSAAVPPASPEAVLQNRESREPANADLVLRSETSDAAIEAGLASESETRQPQAARFGRLRGRLVYKSTGQPIPWYPLWLRAAGGRPETRTTDAQGHFESIHRYDLAAIELNVGEIDRWSDDRWPNAIVIERASADEEVTISIEPGPTIVVLGELPERVTVATLRGTLRSVSSESERTIGEHLRCGGDQWFFRSDALVDVPKKQPTLEEGFDEARARERVETALAGYATEDPQRIAELAQFVEGEIGRMREAYRTAPNTAAVAALPPDVGPWVLELRDISAEIDGQAPLSGVHGVMSVQPNWSELGSLTLHFRGAWTTAPQWELSVQLSSTDAGYAQYETSWILGDLVDQTTTVRGLRQGHYTVRVTCAFCSEVVVRPFVSYGPTTNIEVVLDGPQPLGSIRGEVTTQSGEPPDGGNLFFELRQAGARVLSCEPRIEADDEQRPWRAQFEYVDLPAGAYGLAFDSNGLGIAPSFTTNAHPGDSIALQILDRPDYVDVGFRVFDAESGSELEGYDVDLEGPGVPHDLRAQRSGGIAASHVPETGRFQWRVSKLGYATEHGDTAESAGWPKRDGSKRWIEVRLSRGWSARGWAVDDSGSPLAGVEILVAGERVATSDVDGNFELRLPSRPASIEVRYRDWNWIEREMASLDGLELDGWLQVEFERPR